MATVRSLRSRWSPLSPTHMSAVPLATGAPRSVPSPNACSQVRIASWRRPCALRMSARAIAQPIASEMLPALCTLAMHSAYDRCAVSRSPLAQEASPRRPAAAPRRRWSSSEARSSARRALVTVPATSPRARLWAARHSAIDPGRPQNSSSSTTTISAAGTPGRAVLSPAVPSHRSASRSRASTPSYSPAASSAQAYPALSTGLQRTSSSGSARSQLKHRRFLSTPAHGGHRQLDQPRRALDIRGRQRVTDRIGRRPMSLVPRARAPMQRRDLIGLLRHQWAESTSAKRW